MPGSLFDEVDAQIAAQPISLFDHVDAAMQQGAGSKPPSAAHLARVQADTHGDQYLLDTIKNVPRDAYDQGKGVVDLLRTIVGATGEVGAATGSRVREMFGQQPYYPQGTPNVDALSGMVPAMIDHYAGYMDPEQRALMIRENPVGLALDVAAVTGAARGAVRGGRAAVPAVVQAVRNPIVRAAGSIAADVATGGKASSLRTARELGKIVDELRNPSAPTTAPSATSRLTQSVRSVNGPQTSVSAEGLTAPATMTGGAATMPSGPVPFVMHVPERPVVPPTRTGTGFNGADMPSAPVPFVMHRPEVPVAPTPPPTRTGTGFGGAKMPQEPVPFVIHTRAEPTPRPAEPQAPKPAPVSERPVTEAPASKSKTAVKMSANDLSIYNREINAGKTHDAAMDVVIKERADRASTNYSKEQMDAAARRAAERDRR